MTHQTMMQFAAKVKPEQNCGGYGSIEQSMTCSGTAELTSPVVTQQARIMRDCNMNDTTFIMQPPSTQQKVGHMVNSCGFGTLHHLQQQAFSFRIPVSGHTSSVGKW